MSDLIRREDVNDLIKQICDACGEGEKYNDVMCGACNLDSFIRELDNIPSADPERKWIPVTERLPEEDKDVLVFGVEAISNEYVYGVKRMDVDTWRPRIAPSIRWIAWMPLPEPYGGE